MLMMLLGGSVLAMAFAGRIGVLLQLAGSPVEVSSGKLSEHDREELNGMAPQEQACRLLEKAINHYSAAGDELARRLDGWAGKITTTPDLERLINTAYFSSDLRVRAMALELWLSRDGVRKTPEAVDQLSAEAGARDGRQYFRLSTLG